MSIGAIVVTYQTPVKQLRRCLISLSQNGVVDQQVVNNDTNNIGFAAAANQGAAHLANRLLLFLNPDAELLPNSISLPVQYLSQHPNVGLVGPMLYSPDHVAEKNCYGQPVNPWSLITRQLSTRRLPIAPQPVGWISGGAMLIRRSVFEALSGFDPNFFLYWEDVDLCRRAWQIGRPAHLLPSWHVIHQRGASQPDRFIKTQNYDKSADNYWRKHYSKPIWIFQRYLRILYRLLSPLVD